MFSIGEFSKLSQTTVKTLRFYDAIALFRPVRVDSSSGYRYYSADQVTELGRILHLKALGFPLRQIREVIVEGADPVRLRALLLEKRRDLVRRLREEEVRLAGVDGWLDRLGRGDRSSVPAVTLKRVPPRMIASIRASIARYSDAVDLFEELRRHAGVRAGAGPPAAIWHSCGDTRKPIDCEAYVPLRSTLAATRRVHVYELQASITASVIHRGGSDTIADTYTAARSWIASHGFAIAGSKRELYWRGGLDADRNSDLTEIQFPLSPRRLAVKGLNHDIDTRRRSRHDHPRRGVSPGTACDARTGRD